MHGKTAEDLASKYLTLCGYKILDRNWRCKMGEIDIIASIGWELHFFEVKFRRNLDYGHPFEALDKNKLQKLRKSIDLYLLQVNYGHFWQLDGLCLYMRAGRLKLRMYENLLREV